MDAEARKQINSVRFNWHKRLISDAQLRKHPTAIVFACLVMHRFVIENGYAEISLETATRELNMPKTSVIRARDYLIKRGWIQMRERERSSNGGIATSRYTMSGGPDDLLLEHHEASHGIEHAEAT